MPHQEAAASPGVTPTVAEPPVPPSPDPQATEKNNDEVFQSLVGDLNQIREDLSAIMAEDAKDFEGPQMIGGRIPVTRERLERQERRSALQEREAQISRAIREHTATSTYF